VSIEFEVRKSSSSSQPYYWRIKSVGNSKILASSETYVNKADCVAAMKLVKTGAATATMWDMTGVKPAIVS
jgi:uncharacterized protein YegP (UPF0339 family)